MVQKYAIVSLISNQSTVLYDVINNHNTCHILYKTSRPIDVKWTVVLPPQCMPAFAHSWGWRVLNQSLITRSYMHVHACVHGCWSIRGSVVCLPGGFCVFAGLGSRLVDDSTTSLWSTSYANIMLIMHTAQHGSKMNLMHVLFHAWLSVSLLYLLKSMHFIL